MTATSPEAISAVWSTLEGMASRIGEPETRAHYLAQWRERYDAAFPRWLHDGEIVRLPDWKHVGEISAREKRQAKRVSDAWIEAQADATGGDMAEFDAAKRYAWDLGRRAACGLVESIKAAERALHARFPKMAATKAVAGAFERGCRDADAGEGLLAAIVLDLRCALLPRTGDGLAQRFKLRHGHDFRHTTAKGWLQWDGRRWKVLDEEKGTVPAELLAAIAATVRAIQREGRAIRATGLAQGSIPEHADLLKFKVEVDGVKVSLGSIEAHPDGLDALAITPSTCRLASDSLARFGRSREEDRTIKSVANLAREWLTVKIQEFDTDPLTINCQNGTLRLVRTVDREGVARAEAVLTPHERADLLTKVAAVAYDPAAQCPLYDGTMDWAQPKPEMRRYLHQWSGYNLTGDMGAQIFHVWHGPLAQNGKGTILNAWADCAGDYAAAGKIETFMEAAHAKSGDAATPAMAALPGVRMLRTGEPPSNAKFDESLINQITGQDALMIRALHRGFFEALMQFKLTVACNNPPTIPNATEGIRRRVKVVPFEQTMKGATNPDGTPKRIANFGARLKTELPGIFARLIEGALDWLAHGFAEPDDVTQWTEEYKDDNDPLGRFLDYCTVPEAGARIQSSKFYELFCAWSKATGGPDWTMAYLKKKMNAKGFSSKVSNGVRWLGIAATKEVGDFIDGEGKVRDLSSSDEPAAPWPSTGPPPEMPADWLDEAPDDIGEEDIPF